MSAVAFESIEAKRHGRSALDRGIRTALNRLMARLLSPDGDEICSLARLRIDARVFTAWIAPYLASHPALVSAVLETEEGRRYAVSIESWELLSEGGGQAGYVRGTILVEAPSARPL